MQKKEDDLVPALTDSDNITGLDTDESGGAVSSQVLVSLLVTVVLLHVVQVVTTDDDGTLHLGRNDGPSKDATTDTDVTSKGALLIDVDAIDGLRRGLEPETNILVPAATLTLGNDTLVIEEDGFLLLERTMGL